ncbi:hypothetical protein D9M69_723590 [compost metagenome]
MLVVAEQLGGVAFLLFALGRIDLFDALGEIQLQLGSVFVLQGFQLGQLAVQP